ncbi:MAG: anaerobic ribonucleoside-triphosphate reductase activating protein [Sporomusaceae bacterium]|nr:anaerobic ribonucleoside-triphosphate reductase activating protein [Sporomusaceae bacterium]
MKIRLAGYSPESVVDGPGIRFVLFAQGCEHACPGCHNPQTHDREGGDLVDLAEIFERIKKAKLIRGVTFSGGEPYLQAAPLAQLARQVRALGLGLVTYSGYTFEQLYAMAARDKNIRDLLAASDILVDGKYMAGQRDISLAFRGSANQRLIDVPRSLLAGQAVLWEELDTGDKLFA